MLRRPRAECQGRHGSGDVRRGSKCSAEPMRSMASSAPMASVVEARARVKPVPVPPYEKSRWTRRRNPPT